MFIDDYIEKISLKEEVKNLQATLSTITAENLELKDQNTVLRNTLISRKYEIDSLKYCISVLKKKVYGAESLKEDEGFGDDQINISDEDFLKYRLSNREGKIKELESKIEMLNRDTDKIFKEKHELESIIEMLENDRKEGLKACCDCSHKFQDRIKGLEDEMRKLNEEKQQEGDNLRNRIKDLEGEIDQLKSNPSTVSDSELLAIHTVDVETINKLNIRARDLNGTISTLLERVSKSDEENQELKKKVQQLKDIINDLSTKLYE